MKVHFSFCESLDCLPKPIALYYQTIFNDSSFPAKSRDTSERTMPRTHNIFDQKYPLTRDFSPLYKFFHPMVFCLFSHKHRWNFQKKSQRRTMRNTRSFYPGYYIEMHVLFFYFFGKTLNYILPLIGMIREFSIVYINRRSYSRFKCNGIIRSKFDCAYLYLRL